MANAIFGFSSSVEINGVAVGELTDISGPSFSKDDIEVTNHSSAGGYKEFIGGLIDAGSIDLEMNGYFNNITASKALIELTAQTTATIAIYDVGHTEYILFVANGYLNSFDVSNPVDDKVSMSASFKISGKPVLSTATVLP